MSRLPATPGLLHAQLAAARPDRAERVGPAAEPETAPGWLNSAFAAQAIGQRHAADAPPQGGYGGARRLRPGLAFDLCA